MAGDNIIGHEFAELRAEFESRLERLALGDLPEPTTVARKLKTFIKTKMEEEYLPTLRNKCIEYPDVQYARGGMDALESLLQFLDEHQ